MLGSLAKIPVPEWRAGAEGHAGWDGGHLFELAILETWNQIVTIIPPSLVCVGLWKNA